VKLKDFYRQNRLKQVSQFLELNTPHPTVWQGKRFYTPGDYLRAVGALNPLLDGLSIIVERIGADWTTAVYFQATTNPLEYIEKIIRALPWVEEASAIEVYGENLTKPIIWDLKTPQSNLEWNTSQSQLTVVYTTRRIELFYYYQDGK
jgi:hypothetical protein